MKIHSGFKNWSIPAVLGVASFVALVAWTDNPQLPGGEARRFQDTIPTEKRSDDTRKSPARDFDRELQQLENAKIQLQNQPEIDFEKIKLDIDKAIKEIDVQKIQVEVQAALASIDKEKMRKDIEEAMKSIDKIQIDKEIELALKEVEKLDKTKLKADLEKAKIEMQQAFDSEDFKKGLDEAKKVDMKQIAAELEEAKKEMSKAKMELEGQKLNVKEEMKKAQVELEKATTELRGYQEMVYSMEKQGLLNTKENYTVKFENGSISVNGKELNTADAGKYKHYFKNKKSKVVIRKNDGQLQINND